MLEKEEILKRTNNGLDVFRHYISGSLRIGRNFLNPLYKDSKASCNVYFNRKTGTYYMKDFGNPSYSGDCFFLVASLKGLDNNNASDFVTVLQAINREMNLNISTDTASKGTSDTGSTWLLVPKGPPEALQEKKSSKPRPYSFTQQSMTDPELQYWARSGIGPHVLRQYSVISLRDYKSENKDGQPFHLQSSAAEPMFGYQHKTCIKVYRPFSKLRFLYGHSGELCENYVFGLEQLPAKGDLLFIAAGEKDVLTLAAHGFSAICFNSESCNIDEDIIHRLSFRFKHIMLLYDVDKTGMENSVTQETRLSGYGVRRIILPLPGTKEQKDTTDYFSLGHTRSDLLQLFLKHLDILYNSTMSALKSCEIDFRNPPPIARMIVSAGEVPLGTEGNLLCITGGEGTGKSNYVAALIAGSIRPENASVDTLGVDVAENTENKVVLLYDTEQSEVQLFKNVSKLLKRAGLKDKPDELRAFCLTGMSRKERLQAIVQSMDKFYYQYGGIQVVVIDGIADLVKSANDEAESVAVIDELYRLAGIYKTCIITVLHFIPNGLKLRGHLGSELQRKAAAILSIEKDTTDPGISVVKALKVRDGSPLDVPLMQFAWDKERAMHVYHGEKPREEKEKRKEKELQNVAAEIFTHQQFITYIDLCEQIQSIMDVKERTAKSYIKYMREKEVIIRDPSNSTYFIINHQ
ncbi:bifunctional DNA primase/helicase [Bacteroides fragilis]|nr:bifunctional DNA primase/helicase [Bacteroides fragilis]